MFLALKEMKRAKVRFGLLMVAVALLVFLILFQQTLQNGLLTAFVGGIERQSAPVLVYSTDGLRNLPGSIITPPLEQATRSAPGVGDVGKIGERTISAQAGGTLTGVTFLGYEKPELGGPTTLVSGRLPTGPNEVVAAQGYDKDGFGLGATVTVVPGNLTLTVVGLASEAGLFVSPTLYGSFDTYTAALRAVNPDAAAPLPNALGVAPAPGVSVDQVIQSINGASEDLDALTRDQAAAATPGVAQIQQSFRIIFLLYGLVVPFVTGLFFLIITFQKANALTLLRAIGAPAGRLVSALLVQVLLVMVVGYAIGTLLYFPVTTGSGSSIPLTFETQAVVFWAVVLISLGLLSSWFSARRVLRIDPILATTGAGVGR